MTCILLSAGLSERFGSPKALARIGNSPVIELVQNTLLQSSCDKIIVVLGAHAREIQPSIFIHKRIQIVYNKDYYLGQTSSIQAGWRQADGDSGGMMFLPVDCPLLKSSSINAIIDHFKEHEPDILIPTYQDKKGHPPVFHQRLTSKIIGLPASLGINSLFTEYPPQLIEIDDAGIVKSFNTQEEFEAIRRGGF